MKKSLLAYTAYINKQFDDVLEEHSKNVSTITGNRLNHKIKFFWGIPQNGDQIHRASLLTHNSR